MLAYLEARARIAAERRPLGVERVPLAEAAGRILGEDVHAGAPLPAWDYSAMDGITYAHAEGVTRWRLSGESRAGGGPPGVLAPGTAMRISTGARLPAGADTVAPKEVVELLGEECALRAPVAMGKNVRREGEDLARGARALAAGTRLDVGAVALLGALDLGEVVVTRRPRIALLSTGDELRAPGSPGRVGTIPDASAAMLRALLAKLGGDPAARVHSVDDPAGTTRALEDALGAAELVVTAGGASKGEHDHVRAAVAELGGRMLIDDVAIKPGKPVCVARIGETPVVILPGNPGAAFVTFHAFGAPLLRGLTGEREPALVRGRLATRAEGARGRTELLRCRRELTDDGLTVHILPNQAPGAIVGLEQTDALAEIAAPTDAGALVPVHLL